MNASNIVPSLIRTYVPLAVGLVLGWLATKGLHLDPGARVGITAVLTSVITALYYTAVRLVETRYPAIGTILLGLGIKAKPAYAKPGDPPVHPMRPTPQAPGGTVPPVKP